MTEYRLSYREVISDQTLPDAWRDVTLNTGGTQSTLQDIKVTERANGYCYKDLSKHYTRNRFIYWRINNDVLELVEHSLDINLTRNKVRYKFVDTPILDGITVYETFYNVIILVPTVCSVHRLIFPHPNVLHSKDELVGSHPDLSVPSIFVESAILEPRNSSSFNIFTGPNSSGSQLPHVATSLFTHSEDAYFLFAYPSGEILLVRQSASGQCVMFELKQDSIMPRFISDLAGKFRSKTNDGNVVVSMLLHTFGVEVYALTLCRDGNLRVWSCAKGQLVAVTDIFSETMESNKFLVQSTQNHLLRKNVDCNDAEVTLVVFLNFTSESQFHVFKPYFHGSQFKIERTKTLYSSGQDLVDFNLTSSRIWTLWRGEVGETSIYTAILSEKNNEGTLWIPVVLEPLPDGTATQDTTYADPRQAYLDYIFYPGRFPLQIISKALSIYRKCPVLSEINVSLSVLKQRVSMAVESEIKNELQETEVNDEDYLETANWCWFKFYSCCVQYHVAGLRPLGILLLPSVSGAVLLKKSMYSFLRPLDALEHMLLCSEYASINQFVNHPLLSENLEVAQDVINLLLVIVYLEQQLSDVFKYTFERELSQLQSPDVIMSDLIREIVTDMDEQFTWTIAQKLNFCSDIYQSMHKLLELLRIDCIQVPDGNEPIDYSLEMSVNHVFASLLGVSFVTQCIHQQASVRFTVCRNLLIIQNILLDRGEKEWNTLEAVRSVCLPDIVVLTQATFATLCMTRATISQFVLPEGVMQRLAPLKLNPVFNLKTNNLQIMSLLELFVTSTGGHEAHKLFSRTQLDAESLANWHTSLLPYVAFLTQLVWPISANSTFCEWLLSSGQQVWLQQYVRLLNNWCEWNNCTRKFLLAVSLLTVGEHHKAEDLFLRAAKGIYTDRFFVEHVLSVPPSDSDNRAFVNYYLKVIQLFELHGARDCAINVAKVALNLVDPDDPHLATLHSIKFIHHLKLAHYDEAYNALNSNTDPERKKDNLRDLVKTLLDKRKLQKLMSYPYFNMDELFTNIIFARARATDGVDNIYYDFLYAYQMKKGPGQLRLAASIMYEQGYRLSTQNNIEAIEKQVKCFLAAINALSLCNSTSAWVVRPREGEDVDLLLARLAGNMEEEPEIFKLKKQVDVLQIEDIRKELEISSARLRLARFSKKTLTHHLSTPGELIAFMSSVGIFKYALNLCTRFNLPYDIPFDALAKQCVYLSVNENPQAWNWLVENDLHDLDVVGNSASKVCWNLLKTFIDQYEEKGASQIHRIVCYRIINMGRSLPYWLLASYKTRNPAELLRLFYCSSRLTEAAALTKEYILAALGHGKEHFGFTNGMTAVGPEFCLPLNTIDKLIYELELQSQIYPDKSLDKEHKYLKDMFVEYLETSARVSDEMCKIKLGL